jgi:transcriptional regulator with XRE-family HTH domain
MADDKSPTRRHAATLARLARELNVPLEVFLGEPPDGEVGELLALVRHWSAIQDGQGHRRVLSIARQEAARAGYKECA